MVSVLVVDDEPRIVGLVREYLDRAGFAVLEAADGTQALDLFAEHQPDAVVLDLGLPDMDGVDLLRRLRADSSVPILVLTARADELDRVLGLELGADDYVVKPFGPRELVARIRALLRRPSLGDHLDGDVVVVGDLRIDVPKRQVSVAGAEVALTPTEFDLLETLARQPGRVFSRAQLLDAVHGVSFESYERAIDAHVKNIRRKIEPEPRRYRFVLTVHGVGYKLAET